ncbi:MAG: response regulator transcription factor [Verrucomicrobiae bacterium]|nr:response regulator transcription factor [Verrucomicrobiae bacterium]
MTVKVLAADDHPIFRRGLCEIIEEEDDLKLVGQASSGKEALEMILASPPDVAILDIDMPQMTGLEAARVLSGKELPTRIILLTMHEDEALFNEAVDLGVVGYVLKENAVDDVVKAIRIVAEGGTFISPSVADFLFRRSRRTRELHKEKPGLENLTPAEKRILRQIAEDRTSKEIANELGISVRTVETHRQNISAKLGLSGSHSLVKFAFHNKSHL